MNWFFIILCVVCAALFPDLPLLAGRIWGYESHVPLILSGTMFLVSAIFLFVYIFTTMMDGGRWLASAFVALSLIGVGSGLLASVGMLGVLSPNLYNIFRGFLAHLFQVITVVFLLLHVFENMGRRRAVG